MPWCSKPSDCTSNGCKDCALCKLSPGLSKACEPWCSRPNCRKEACSGCGFCESLGDVIACDSDMPNDMSYEECAKWCNAGHSSEHCKFCACRACTYCEHASGLVRESGKPCPPQQEGDSETMRCESFCRESHRDTHCDVCKCKACPFCPLRLDTGVTCPLAPAGARALPRSDAALGVSVNADEDSATLRCEPFCSLANVATHCLLCKCAACSFCAAAAPRHASNLTASELLLLQVARLKAVASPPPPPPLPLASPPMLALGAATIAMTPQQRLLCPPLAEMLWERASSGASSAPSLVLRLRQWDESLVITMFVRASGGREPRLRAEASTGGAIARRWFEPGTDDDTAAAASAAGIQTSTSHATASATSSASAAFAAAAHPSPASSPTSSLALPPSMHALSIRLRRPAAVPLSTVPEMYLTSTAAAFIAPVVVCIALPPSQQALAHGTPSSRAPAASRPAVRAVPAFAQPTQHRAPITESAAPAPQMTADEAHGWGEAQPAVAPMAADGGSFVPRDFSAAFNAPADSRSSTSASLYLLFLLLAASLPLYLLYAARSRLQQVHARIPTQEQELEDWADDPEEESSVSSAMASSEASRQGGFASPSLTSPISGGSHGGRSGRSPGGRGMTVNSTLDAAAILDDEPPRRSALHGLGVVPTLPAPPGASRGSRELVWVDDESAVNKSIESRRHAKLKAQDFD